MEKRVAFDEMVDVFTTILKQKGFDDETSKISGRLFAENSLDGIYSHGVNRFPRVLSYIEKGYIDPKAKPECINSMGAMERWDGKLAMGNSTAHLAMARAIELAKDNGIGIVAIKNTNHWMRGGAYGWQAANAGMIGMCWTNTMPNMPVWGSKNRCIGNNPFIMAVPRSNGAHVIVDCAMAQFSYGKIEEAKLAGKQLPFNGGFDSNGNVTTDPVEIEKTWRVLPVGFWKGSGLSVLLDLIASVLANGDTVTAVGKKREDEYGLSQLLIAINPKVFNSVQVNDEIINELIEDIKRAEKADGVDEIYYPGELELMKRKENLQKGIPVVEEIWNKILAELNK